MELSRVLQGVPVITDVPADLLTSEVRGLAYDSRKVEPGYLFFAFAGARADGAQFASAALQKGGFAVISDRPAPGGFHGAWLQVPHGRQALASASRNFFERPDERIALTAVTGTNGKTTSTQLVDAILRAAGKTTALIGTIEYHLAGRVLPAVNTTPESLDLFALMHDLEQAGGTHFTLEASSHALDLGRIYGVNVHAAGWTNLTRDHLDYHETMEAYFAAKQLLFTPRSGPPPRFAVLNAADEGARQLRIAPETRVLWYGEDDVPRHRDSDIRLFAENIKSDFQSLQFTVSA
ncbi:MAG: UDP-N-acetylmuramoyl-L-alanyl-D-glutamate--2,6-diaminopimelate ligase, partial [Acidobacteriaceae bacterium]|nr:UDP-N-acetylmuramoyl-L-alanyl-D-glutamate--2,6-diaminopimelate ligase [Acidobacteriaceae bacterium]